MSGFLTYLSNNKSSILTGLGVGSLLSAVVVSFGFGAMARDALVEEMERQGVDELSPKDTIKTMAPYVIPPAVLAIGGTACVAAGHHSDVKDKAAAIAAAALQEASTKTYKEEAKKILGEKKEKTIQEAADKALHDKTVNSGQLVVVNGEGDFLMYDTLTNQYIHNRIDNVKNIIADMNLEISMDRDVSLDDYCLRMGEKPMEFGNNLVWRADRGKIVTRYTADIAQNGEPYIIIAHENIPNIIS